MHVFEPGPQVTLVFLGGYQPSTVSTVITQFFYFHVHKSFNPIKLHKPYPFLRVTYPSIMVNHGARFLSTKQSTFNPPLTHPRSLQIRSGMTGEWPRTLPSLQARDPKGPEGASPPWALGEGGTTHHSREILCTWWYLVIDQSFVRVNMLAYDFGMLRIDHETSTAKDDTCIYSERFKYSKNNDGWYFFWCVSSENYVMLDMIWWDSRYEYLDELCCDLTCRCHWNDGFGVTQVSASLSYYQHDDWSRNW